MYFYIKNDVAPPLPPVRPLVSVGELSPLRFVLPTAPLTPGTCTHQEGTVGSAHQWAAPTTCPMHRQPATCTKRLPPAQSTCHELKAPASNRKHLPQTKSTSHLLKAPASYNKLQTPLHRALATGTEHLPSLRHRATTSTELTTSSKTPDTCTEHLPNTEITSQSKCPNNTPMTPLTS